MYLLFYKGRYVILINKHVLQFKKNKIFKILGAFFFLTYQINFASDVKTKQKAIIK